MADFLTQVILPLAFVLIKPKIFRLLAPLIGQKTPLLNENLVIRTISHIK